MSYINFPSPTPVFPVLQPLTWSVHKKPIMASSVVTAASGRETQLARAVYPRFAFTLSYGNTAWLRDQTQNITPDALLAGFTELEQISGLFLACLGSYGEFYYNDPSDNSRLNQGVGTGDTVTTTYPLYFEWGTGPFAPPMFMPVQGIIAIQAVYFDGFIQSPSIYSLDSTRTQLVFLSPPPLNVVITADFSFYYRCRFLDDQQNYAQFAKNLWENKEVRFESVKP